MAFEIPVQILSFTAASDMSAASCQFAFVEQASNGDVHLCNAATDIPLGVLQNTPQRGQTAEVCVLGVTKVRVGATDITSAGGLLGTDATGRAATYVAGGTGTATFIVGRVIAIDATNNDGALVTALVNCANPARGD